MTQPRSPGAGGPPVTDDERVIRALDRLAAQLAHTQAALHSLLLECGEAEGAAGADVSDADVLLGAGRPAPPEALAPYLRASVELDEHEHPPR